MSTLQKAEYRCKVPNCKAPTFDDDGLLQMHMAARHPRGLAMNAVILGDPVEHSIPELIKKGIQTPSDYMTLMTAVMKGIAEKSLEVDEARAICAASKEMLKMFELMIRAAKR